jgi:hypothetical protein
MKINLKSVTKIIALSVAVLGAFDCVSKADDLPKALPFINEGFEGNLTSWAVIPTFNGQIEVVDSPVHSGNKAVRIDATQVQNSPYVAHTISGLTGGAVYQFSAWARVAPGSPAVTAALKTEAYGDNGSTGDLYSTKMLTADGTWTKVTLQQRMSGDTKAATLLLRVFGAGAVIFDDVTFEEVGYPPDLTITGSTQLTTAAESPRELPLVNPGFEDELTSWEVLPAYNGQIGVVNDPVHSGSNAVKIDATQIQNSPYVAQGIGGLEGGALYQFSAWAKAAPDSPAARAAIKMEAYGAAGTTSEQYVTKELSADGAWTKISLRQRVSDDTSRAGFLLRVFDDGAVIFDDVSFEKIGYSAENSITVTYVLILRQPWTESELPNITATISSLDDPDNSSEITTVPAIVERGDQDNQLKVTITVPGLSDGSYAVQFQTQGDAPLQTVYPAYIFTTLADRKPTALTQNGTFLWNGNPFFPIGMYHAVSEADYMALSENGFNAVQGDADLDMDNFKASLDLAQKYGLAVDVPLYNGMQVKANLTNSLEKVNLFADHPAILDWKIFDEPDIKPDGGVAIDIPSTYRALKAADPIHPFELTLNSAATQQFWSNFCDVVQADVYPLPLSPITKVSDMAKGAKDLMLPWQNLSIVLQCGWMADLSNQPSVAQARSMVYMALINGAKGIWWYSMHDPGWDLTQTPLWPHMKDINAEIKVLSEPLMLGDDVPLQISNANVQASAKKYQGKLYVLVTNPTDDANDVTLTFSGLPNINDGTFMGSTVQMQHSTDNPNYISLQLTSLQSGTLIFNLP